MVIVNENGTNFSNLYLRGYYTPYQKLTCFVLYLKIINTIVKNNIHMHLISYSKLSKKFKNNIKI